MSIGSYAMEKEWLAWQDLCQLLKREGFVTQKDLDTGVSSPESLNGATPGLRLLNSIRAWGETKEALALENEREE